MNFKHLDLAEAVRHRHRPQALGDEELADLGVLPMRSKIDDRLDRELGVGGLQEPLHHLQGRGLPAGLVLRDRRLLGPGHTANWCWDKPAALRATSMTVFVGSTAHRISLIIDWELPLHTYWMRSENRLGLIEPSRSNP